MVCLFFVAVFLLFPVNRQLYRICYVHFYVTVQPSASLSRVVTM